MNTKPSPLETLPGPRFGTELLEELGRVLQDQPANKWLALTLWARKQPGHSLELYNVAAEVPPLGPAGPSDLTEPEIAAVCRSMGRALYSVVPADEAYQFARAILRAQRAKLAAANTGR